MLWGAHQSTVSGMPATDVCIAQVFMARDGQFVGSLTLSDRVREDAAHTVQQLQDRGYHTIMLTGVPACTAHRETLSSARSVSLQASSFSATYSACREMLQSML